VTVDPTNLFPASTAVVVIGAGSRYQGRLCQDSVRGHEVWRCDHAHNARSGALACARSELVRRRGDSVAAPERRGDWGGLTQRAPGCIRVAGDPYRVPVCPLCAGSRLHTQAEHDQLEAAVLKAQHTRSVHSDPRRRLP
jgi:hypothetical protein